jgi:hypothetical protein
LRLPPCVTIQNYKSSFGTWIIWNTYRQCSAPVLRQKMSENSNATEMKRSCCSPSFTIRDSHHRRKTHDIVHQAFAQCGVPERTRLAGSVIEKIINTMGLAHTGPDTWRTCIRWMTCLMSRACLFTARLHSILHRCATCLTGLSVFWRHWCFDGDNYIYQRDARNRAFHILWDKSGETALKLDEKQIWELLFCVSIHRPAVYIKPGYYTACSTEWYRTFSVVSVSAKKRVYTEIVPLSVWHKEARPMGILNNLGQDLCPKLVVSVVKKKSSKVRRCCTLATPSSRIGVQGQRIETVGRTIIPWGNRRWWPETKILKNGVPGRVGKELCGNVRVNKVVPEIAQFPNRLAVRWFLRQSDCNLKWDDL